ncbi:hypothetical protein ACH5RR_008942 [Cinchona calisaya]|uniref:Uncharacterized protein n=1 Tax=Cinchona calisaya TaxID=153742 RepID=A0ABD3AGP7_9GENT
MGCSLAGKVSREVWINVDMQVRTLRLGWEELWLQELIEMGKDLLKMMAIWMNMAFCWKMLTVNLTVILTGMALNSAKGPG